MNLSLFTGRAAIVLLLSFAFNNARSQTNNALSFDGSNDYIEIADNNALDLSSSFTLEAWIYPTGPGSQATEGGMIINKENSYEIARFADGTIRFALSANGAGSDWSWNNTGIVAPLNQWSHITMVKSGTSVTTYLNGVSASTINSQPANLTANAQTLRIGGRTLASHYFAGTIDEVRLWNTARTQTDIKTNMYNKNLPNNSGGLVAYYRMNEASGTTTSNSCTNTAGIDGTLTNGPSRIASPVQFGSNSLSFDGVDDYVVSTATFNLNMNSSSFTVEAWINSANASANTTTERILMQWGPTWQAGAYQLVCTNTYIHFNFNGSSTGSCTYSVNWQDGNWHHVAGVFDVSSHMLYLYFDGVQRAAVSTGSNAPGALNTSLYIGGSPGVANSFVSAKIDEVRVWNAARTQAEIQANMFKELNHPFLVSGSVPRLYYTFNQGSAEGTNSGLVTVTEQYLQAHGNGTLVNFALSGTSSNYTMQNSSVFVLPLKWVSFTAQKENKSVLLDWSTESEINTRDFVIQHKAATGEWKDIAAVSAAGNTNAISNYAYRHLTPAAGINYYRIRQNDLDGKFSFSEIRSVKITGATNVFRVMQNSGFDHVLRIRIDQAGVLPLSLFNSEGKLLWTKTLAQGMHDIDVNHLSKGIYFLKAGMHSQAVAIW